MGGEVMFAASRAEDGRGDETLLRQAVIEHFDARDILQVIERMHFKEIPEARIHELAPVLFAVADRGDPVAAKLVDRLAAEVSAYAIASLRRLGMLGLPASIVLGGGVLAARHHLCGPGDREPGARGGGTAAIHLRLRGAHSRGGPSGARLHRRH